MTAMYVSSVVLAVLTYLIWRDATLLAAIPVMGLCLYLTFRNRLCLEDKELDDRRARIGFAGFVLVLVALVASFFTDRISTEEVSSWFLAGFVASLAAVLVSVPRSTVYGWQQLGRWLMPISALLLAVLGAGIFPLDTTGDSSNTSASTPTTTAATTPSRTATTSDEDVQPIRPTAKERKAAERKAAAERRAEAAVERRKQRWRADQKKIKQRRINRRVAARKQREARQRREREARRQRQQPAAPAVRQPTAPPPPPPPPPVYNPPPPPPPARRPPPPPPPPPPPDEDVERIGGT